jgi:5S rRNA maturation endonuclease (ribonuclease M5)
MAKVVFRVEKIKTAGNLSAAISHQMRTRPTANANLAVRNLVLKEPEGGIEDWMKQITELNGGQLRKGGVIATDIVISASPDYFRPADPAQAGYYEPEKLQAWRDAMEPWIAENFPHALGVQLHLDEATPHYTIIDIPFNPKTGKLSHREKFGGDKRIDLGAWQTKAAEPVAHLGIERGIKGSTAEHTDINAYYGRINKPTPKFSKLPDPIPPGLLNRTEKDLVAFANAERKLALGAMKPAYLSAVTKAQALDLAIQQRNDIAYTNTKLSAEKDALKREADKLRELPLDSVLKRIYGAKLEDDSRDTHNSRKYELADGRKIGVSEGSNGADVWIIQGDKGKRGAINLVMELDGLDYKGAVRLLSEYYGSNEVAAEVTATKQLQSLKEVEAIKALPLTPPAPAPEMWPRVKKYLSEVRYLPLKLIDWLHGSGSVFADNNANAVFPREHGGAFLRGTSSKPFFRAIGGKDQGAYVIPGTGDCWICESPVDAASIKAMKPDAHIIAMGGSMLKVSDINAPESRKIVLAFDNDGAGRAFTAEAQKKWPNATIAKPSKKDWNESIKMDASLIDSTWHESDESASNTKTLTSAPRL